MDNAWLFAIAALITVYVILQSAVFLRKAWRRALEIGMDKSALKKVVRVSAMFSVVPSVPIMIGLATMVPMLGAALPYIRLSVIGSVQYELYAAGQAAAAAGGNMEQGMSPEAFAAAAVIMTVGIIWGPIFNIFFFKKYENKLYTIKQRNAKWGEILVGALFMGLVGTIGAQQIVLGGVSLLTLLTSAALMAIFGLLVKKLKWQWLENFALPLSILGSLLLAFVYQGALGTGGV